MNVIGNVRSRLAGRRAKKSVFKGEFKAHEFPEGMVVVVDTREQTPLFVKMPKGMVVTRDTLKHGDYSILGFEDRFTIERKGMSDFLGYVSHERKKTVEKMKVFKGMDFAALVVEVDEDELYFGSVHSLVGAEVIRQALVSFQVRYGVHVYVTDDREKIERVVLDWMIKYYKVMKEA